MCRLIVYKVRGRERAPHKPRGTRSREGMVVVDTTAWGKEAEEERGRRRRSSDKDVSHLVVDSQGRDRKHAICLADLVVRPVHSIIRQSFDSRERLSGGAVPPHLNGDGFGIGWFSDEPQEGEDGGAGATESPAGAEGATGTAVTLRSEDKPGVYTSITPAWNNLNLVRLSEKIRSSCIFAHVRAASPGSLVTEANCHPFASGRYLFMHNGFLGGFPILRRRIVQSVTDHALDAIQGTSDSAYCFGMFLTEVEKEGPLHARLSSAALQRCTIRTIHALEHMIRACRIRASSLLNFVISDGRTIIATRHVIGRGTPATLYFGTGSQWSESKEKPGEFHMEQSDRRGHAVIVASERLSGCQEDWLEVPPNTIFTVGPDMNVLLTPIPSAPLIDGETVPTTPAVAGGGGAATVDSAAAPSASATSSSSSSSASMAPSSGPTTAPTPVRHRKRGFAELAVTVVDGDRTFIAPPAHEAKRNPLLNPSAPDSPLPLPLLSAPSFLFRHRAPPSPLVGGFGASHAPFLPPPLATAGSSPLSCELTLGSAASEACDDRARAGGRGQGAAVPACGSAILGPSVAFSLPNLGLCPSGLLAATGGAGVGLGRGEIEEAKKVRGMLHPAARHLLPPSLARGGASASKEPEDLVRCPPLVMGWSPTMVSGMAWAPDGTFGHGFAGTGSGLSSRGGLAAASARGRDAAGEEEWEVEPSMRLDDAR